MLRDARSYPPNVTHAESAMLASCFVYLRHNCFCSSMYFHRLHQSTWTMQWATYMKNDVIWIIDGNVTVGELVAVLYGGRARGVSRVVVGVLVLKLQRWRGRGGATFFPPWQIDIRIESWEEYKPKKDTLKVSAYHIYTYSQTVQEVLSFNW